MENYQKDLALQAAKEWTQRPLAEIYPVVRFDELAYCVFVDSKIVKKYAYVATAIDLTGRKEVLGFWVNHDRTAAAWSEAIGSLKKRGIKDIFIVCADNLAGLSDALLMHFPKTDLQAEATHLLQGSLKFVFCKDHGAIKAGLKAVYMSENAASAANALNDFADKWDEKYPAIARFWRENWQNLGRYFAYPQEIRSLIQPIGQITVLVRSLRKKALLHPLTASDDDLLRELYLETLRQMSNGRGASNYWNATYLQLERFFGSRMPKR